MFHFDFWKVLRWMLLAGILTLPIFMWDGLTAPVHADSGSVTDCAQFDDSNTADGKDTLGELLPGGGTITFQCGGTITLPLRTQIDISVVTTLNANGNNVTIQGNQARVFQVNNGASLTLSGITVTEGYTTGSGGGILILENGIVDPRDSRVQ